MSMDLKKQVTNLELSKKLKELGVKQDSLFKWHSKKDEDGNRCYTEVRFLPNTLLDLDYPAYTVAELGNILPKMITFQETPYFYTTWKRTHGWATQYKPNKGHNYFPAQLGNTEANARAKMLCYLLENNLIKL